MRRLVPAVAVALAALSVSQPRALAQAEPLVWKLPHTAVLEFERVSTDTGDSFGGLEGKFLLTGGQFKPSGAMDAIVHPACPASEVLPRLIFALPPAGPKPAAKWKSSFDTTACKPALARFPDSIDLTFEHAGAKEFAGRQCLLVRVRGSGSDPEPEKPKPDTLYRAGGANPQLTDFVLEAEVYYDPAGFARGFAGTLACNAPNDWSAKERKCGFDYQLARFEMFDQRASFDQRINRCIERAIVQVKTDKFWRTGRGTAALVAYTLLQCGLKPDDETVVAALAAMRDGPKLQQFGKLYHAALCVMALEAKVIPEAERIGQAEGRQPGVIVRNLTPEDRKLMQEYLGFIAKAVLADHPGLWSYANDQVLRPDLSNTQFAVLAMAAAQRCGCDLPRGLLKTAGEQVLRFQQLEGPKLKRVVSRDATGKVTRSTKVTEARGFGYHLPDTPAAGYAGKAEVLAYGSMTSAGVCSLLLLADMVEAMTPERRAQEFPSGLKTWRQKVEEGIESGLTWLEVNFSVTRNPHSKDNATNYYFYMYAIERAGALSPTEVLGEHEWYREGAAVLAMQQKEDGNWNDVHDNCFALLFLKRATVPTRSRVITGK